MFGFFKKRAPFPSAEELSRLSQAACADVRAKWVQFHSTVHLKAEVPLAQKIDLFAQPLTQFFQSKYPQLLLGGSEIFWLTTFTAILESGTHPKEGSMPFRVERNDLISVRLVQTDERADA